jgi:hypothetical protein
MTKQTSHKFSPEVHERAVRMVFDHQTEYSFGERRVCLLQTTELTRFVRRTRYVHEQCPEFGRFRPVLLCAEHLIGPFRGKVQLISRLPTRGFHLPAVIKGGWSCSSRSSVCLA